MHSALLPTPIGPLYVEAEGDAIDPPLHRRAPVPRRGRARSRGTLRRAAAQLDEYFAGERTTFDVPLAQHGTPFELRVWDRLRAIPYGETTTYGEIARELGSSARAVGRANGRNPISIIVPCHRVVGADGSLTGYAGGLEAKRALLDHELRRRAAIGAARRRVLTRRGVERSTAVRATGPICVALARPQPKAAKARILIGSSFPAGSAGLGAAAPHRHTTGYRPHVPRT